MPLPSRRRAGWGVPQLSQIDVAALIRALEDAGIAEGAVVGRFMFFSTTPGGLPWMWTIAPDTRKTERPPTATRQHSKPRPRTGIHGKASADASSARKGRP
jgi:hypothetical protein